MLLSRGVISRMNAQRLSERREAALQRAECALELARAAVQTGQLAPGGAFTAEKMSVACSATPSGIKLEALSLLDSQPTARALRVLSRGVRVSWNLSRGPGQGNWRRIDCSARDETLP